MRTLGIILIVVGLVMTIFTGFDVVTKKEVVDIGRLEINKEERTPIYWNPVLGIIILVGGVAVVFTSKKK